jgi:hypothetical protein
LEEVDDGPKPGFALLAVPSFNNQIDIVHLYDALYVFAELDESMETLLITDICMKFRRF